MPGTTMRSLACAAALAIVLATNVATPAAGAEAPGRTLRVGMPLIPDTLDPARADNMQAMYLMAGIYDTLFVLDPVARPAAIVPMAAATLPRFPPITAPSPSASGRGSSSRHIRASAVSRAN